MKIQLKRSNVLQAGSAKSPTADQMEYGELAVNYNAQDPVIFIKDSSNNIIRLTNMTVEWDEIQNRPVVNDGQINIAAGDGLTASGSNATANQAANTTRTLEVDTAWLTQFIDAALTIGDGAINIAAGDGLIATGDNATANQTGDTTRTLEVDTAWLNALLGDGAINIAAGDGLTASGDNATANQSGDTTRTLEIDTAWLDQYIGTPATVGDGAINIAAGDGLQASGENATANQTADTTRTLTAVADDGYAIDITPTGIRLGNNWSNIPLLPTTTTVSAQAIDGYYPLYANEAEANAAGDGTSHSHTFNGVTYYMPNGVTYYHGDYSG